MATTTQETGRHIALVDIRVPDNVRDLGPEHVKALAGSIELQGMLVPVVVRNDGDGFELVAGFHRVAAARSLGLAEVPVVVRDAVTPCWPTPATGTRSRWKRIVDRVINRGIDRFHRRGRAAVRTEWRPITATHNLLARHHHTLATA